MRSATIWKASAGGNCSAAVGWRLPRREPRPGTHIRRSSIMIRIAATLLLATVCAQAQFMLTREQMIAYTAGSPYERFAGGRPKVPDALLEKVKGMVTEELYGAVRGKGFQNQFTGDW